MPKVANAKRISGVAQPVQRATARYQADRDASALPMYEFTTQLATLEPPPPEMQKLLGCCTAYRVIDRMGRAQKARKTAPGEDILSHCWKTANSVVRTKGAT